MAALTAGCGSAEPSASDEVPLDGSWVLTAGSNGSERLEPVLVDRRTGVELEPRRTRAVYDDGRGLRPTGH